VAEGYTSLATVPGGLRGARLRPIPLLKAGGRLPDLPCIPVRRIRSRGQPAPGRSYACLVAMVQRKDYLAAQRTFFSVPGTAGQMVVRMHSGNSLMDQTAERTFCAANMEHMLSIGSSPPSRAAGVNCPKLRLPTAPVAAT
jgi:hypothetical protein